MAADPPSKRLKVGGGDGSAAGSSACRYYRFNITELMQGGNYDNSAPKNMPDASIVLPPSGASLYALLSAVFDARVTDDGIEDHIWTCSLAGQRYAGPVGQCGFRGEAECTAEQPVPLTPLGLAVGAAGSFANESASFRYELEGIHPDATAAEAAVVAAAAGAAERQGQITADCKKPDHLTTVEIAAAEELRTKWAAYMAGPNTWVRDRKARPTFNEATGNVNYGYIRGKPKPAGWEDHHGSSAHPLFKIHDVMALLINGGVGFSQAWTAVLQYCCVNRTKAACANRYSMLKREDYMISGIGRGLSQSELVVDAKRMAQAVTKTRLREGVPALGPKPTGWQD